MVGDSRNRSVSTHAHTHTHTCEHTHTHSLSHTHTHTYTHTHTHMHTHTHTQYGITTGAVCLSRKKVDEQSAPRQSLVSNQTKSNPSQERGFLSCLVFMPACLGLSVLYGCDCLFFYLRFSLFVAHAISPSLYFCSQKL